jgi:predicted nucleic acid-binding protein
VSLDDPVGVELAVELQEQIAGGQSLRYDLEHFGEAAIISLACRAQRLRSLMLSDDYDARVAARNRNVEPLSVHKLLHLMIRQGKVSASQAAGFASALHEAGRAQDYTASELSYGRLGRVGQP